MSNVEQNQTVTAGGDQHEAAALSSFDPARYRADVDEFDITEEQKRELLATLWSIMSSFVELGFKVDVVSALLSADGIPADKELS